MKGVPAEDNELKDFNRAVALQATPQQVDLFRQLAKDTTAAAAKAENLAQHPEKIREDASILAYVVEVAGTAAMISWQNSRTRRNLD